MWKCRILYHGSVRWVRFMFYLCHACRSLLTASTVGHRATRWHNKSRLKIESTGCTTRTRNLVQLAWRLVEPSCTVSTCLVVVFNQRSCCCCWWWWCWSPNQCCSIKASDTLLWISISLYPLATSPSIFFAFISTYFFSLRVLDEVRRSSGWMYRVQFIVHVAYFLCSF